MLGFRRHLSLGTAISQAMLGMGTTSGCSISPPASATGVDASADDAGSPASSERSSSFAYAASLERGINVGNAFEAAKKSDLGVTLTDADFDFSRLPRPVIPRRCDHIERPGCEFRAIVAQSLFDPAAPHVFARAAAGHGPKHAVGLRIATKPRRECASREVHAGVAR